MPIVLTTPEIVVTETIQADRAAIVKIVIDVEASCIGVVVEYSLTINHPEIVVEESENVMGSVTPAWTETKVTRRENIEITGGEFAAIATSVTTTSTLYQEIKRVLYTYLLSTGKVSGTAS